MYIKRHIETVVSDLLKEYPCMLISGPRQVGKTTLIQNLKEDKPREYITLDDIALRSAAKSDPKIFLQDHKPPICIDEIQYAPELFPYIKIIIDKYHRPGDFILTGSQIYRLMRNVSESLAGRIVLLNMQGFSLSEITGLPNLPFLPDRDAYIARNQKDPLDSPAVFDRIFRGGMPEIISGLHSDPAMFYSSYISTYLTRDIRDIMQVDDLKFFRFLTSSAARTAQILNVAEIARDAEISVPTANSWLNILETLGIIFYLHPYHNNLLKRTIKKPKLYFYDTGLACHLARWISAEALASGAQNGAMFETFAVSEIMKSYFNAGRDPYVYYYRDTDMREIDLILEQNQTLYPIEIKKASHIDRRVATTFKLIEKSGLKQGLGAVICMNDRLGSINKNTVTIPITSV
ncbi:MAG: ATP-binding protein [Christensenellaceae bacterium]|jgi:predicted AAA+ superfamily ATPase|nr:ATP-binding protein [Christensenellaceae bacterium]